MKGNERPAMHILRVNSISVNLAGRELFRGLSWVIGDRDRVALVGPNGAGKSTLFKVLRGEIEAVDGHVWRQSDIRIGYLPQDISLPPDATLIETAMTKPPELAEAELALNKIESQLADPDVYDDAESLAMTLSRHEAQLANYERMNGSRHASHVRRVTGNAGIHRR